MVRIYDIPDNTFESSDEDDEEEEEEEEDDEKGKWKGRAMATEHSLKSSTLNKTPLVSF